MPRKSIMDISVQINKEALLVLLRERLEPDAIKEPSNEPDNKGDYLIKKNKFAKLFQKDGKFIDSVIEQQYSSWSTYIPLKIVIDFFRFNATNMNKGKYTQGFYHMYMDYIHTMYNIKCNHINDKVKDGLGLPNYNHIKAINTVLYNTIYPARLEFMFAWWMMNNVRNYITKYKYEVDIGFQERIGGKIYDIVIDPLNIVIEYQEARSNHTDVDSDKDKKAIVRAEAKIIEYFQESRYNEEGNQYLEYFWHNNLKRRINQFLIKDKKNNSFINDYLFDMFKSTLKIQKNALKKTLKTETDDNIDYIRDRINQIDALLNGNNEQVKKIFSWKDKERLDKSHDKYIISSDDIAQLLHVTTKISKNEIIKNMKELVIAHVKNNKYYTNWNGLITLLIMIDTCTNIEIRRETKRVVTDYLLNTQALYDNHIIDELNAYHMDLLSNIMEDVQRREDCVVQKLEAKYGRDIENLSDKNGEQSIIIRDLKKTVRIITSRNKKLVSELNTLSDVLNDKRKSKPCVNALLKTANEIEGIMDKFEENEAKSFVLRNLLVINEPIINTIPDIIYTGVNKSKIPINVLKSYLERHKIPSPSTIIKNIISVICPHANNLKFISKIKLIEFSDDDDSDYVTESESESESSDDEDNDDKNKDVESDSNSDSDNESDRGNDLDIGV